MEVIAADGHEGWMETWLDVDGSYDEPDEELHERMDCIRRIGLSDAEHAGIRHPGRRSGEEEEG